MPAHRKPRITIICEWCGQSFQALPSQKRRFHSQSCAVSARNHRPTEDRFWEKVDKSGTCWEWTAGKNPDGYGQFHAPETEEAGAHRFSYRLHHGDIPPGSEICHTCDNPGCVNPEHLFLGDRDSNMKDMSTKGRNCSPLSEDQAREIKQRRQAGEPCKVLAKEYGVAESTISRIANGIRWKWL